MDMLRYMVLFTSHCPLAIGNVLVLIVLSVKKVFRFPSSSMKMQPAFVDGLFYTLGCNASLMKPSRDRSKGFVRWSEGFGDLVESPMLRVVRRFRIRAIELALTWYDRARADYSHIHEPIVAFV